MIAFKGAAILFGAKYMLFFDYLNSLVPNDLDFLSNILIYFKNILVNIRDKIAIGVTASAPVSLLQPIFDWAGKFIASGLLSIIVWWIIRFIIGL